MVTVRRSRLKVNAAFSLLLVVAVMTLAGCGVANQPPVATAPSRVSTDDWPTAQVSHTGRQETTLAVPAGAKSLHVDFACTNGLYEISPQISVDTRSGMCGGAQSFDFDISSEHAGSQLRLDFVVPDDTRFVATTHFSANKFMPDKATKSGCASLSKIIEAYWNADEGYDHKDVTDAQWMTATADAKAQLAALASTTRNQPASSGLLGQVVPALATWLTGAGDHPGGMLHAPGGDFTAANGLAGQICSANGTGIAIHSKYGG